MPIKIKVVLTIWGLTYFNFLGCKKMFTSCNEIPFIMWIVRILLYHYSDVFHNDVLFHFIKTKLIKKMSKFKQLCFLTCRFRKWTCMYKYTCITDIWYLTGLYSVYVIAKEAPPFRFRICELWGAACALEICELYTVHYAIFLGHHVADWEFDSSVCMLYTGTGANLLDFQKCFLEIYRPSFCENKPNVRTTENERFGLVFAKTGSINSALITMGNRELSVVFSWTA